jgi:hypothetical protein
MKKKTIHYRDAENGQYINPKKAIKNPKTTVRETDKKPLRSKKTK